MSDGLTDEERKLAWLASWNPSFAGKAIVNPDFTFRSVNRQFCEIVGVTPAEIINSKFTDLTPEPVKTLDVKNAKLVKEGKIESYILPKVYEFASGKRVDVILLVKGVYHPKTSEFLFYVSSIMANDKKLNAQSLSRQPIGLLDWIDKKKAGWGILTLIGASLAAAADKIIKALAN